MTMLIRHAIFHCKQYCFRGLSSWLSARSSTLLMLVGVRALRNCMDDHLTARYQSNLSLIHI